MFLKTKVIVNPEFHQGAHHNNEYLEQFGMSYYKQNLRRSHSDIGGFSLSELFLEGSPKGPEDCLSTLDSTGWC